MTQNEQDELKNSEEDKELRILQGAQVGEHDDDDEYLPDMYRSWFLEYASYVILDRAIPTLSDGLKPVQRRILYSMYELEDGRYNKAANVIGHTMRYHPHGDMAISDAMVKIAQKDLLIDTQGNWGNPVTGDVAAASRYIEARLTDFAKDVLFNDKTTTWTRSYDGRNKEPVELPVKFPLLLVQGADGIAVGLSTKILPHNFTEVIRESIAYLKGYKPQLLPDFQTGGSADFSEYKNGKKGGKVKVRAKIEKEGTKTLKITEVPFGVTTQSLIDSIVAAGDKNKIKLKKIEDNSAESVEILVHLVQGTNIDQALQQLFVYTDCEISISPNCCVIEDTKPRFCSVQDVLIASTERTKELLKKELIIAKNELEEKIFASLLEKHFIQEKIYRKIETCESWEEVLSKVTKAIKNLELKLHRPIEEKDIEKLTEIKIKKISKYDGKKLEGQIKCYISDLEEVNNNLKFLTKYAISYFKDLLKKYGKNKKRLTIIDSFEPMDVKQLKIKDQKIYVNREEGFAGTGLKGEEFLFDCSIKDELIGFSQDGSYRVGKVDKKVFFGKDLIHLDIFDREKVNDVVYRVLYKEGRSGPYKAKKFSVTAASKDKDYRIFPESSFNKILYFSAAGPLDDEQLVIQTLVRSGKKEKEVELTLNFMNIPLKKRSGSGTVITTDKVKKVQKKIEGATASSHVQRIWFNKESNELNLDGKGIYLGPFRREDKIIVLYKNGNYEIEPFSLETKIKKDVLAVQKLSPHLVISVIYEDKTQGGSFVERFAVKNLEPGKYAHFKEAKDKQIMLSTMKEDEKQFGALSQKGNSAGEQPISLGEFLKSNDLGIMGKKLGLS